jgi:O-antigen/teichoic acid export membrane protein
VEIGRGDTLKDGLEVEEDRSKGNFRNVEGNLSKTSISGGSSLLISEVGCNIFRVLGMVILARLLMPEHFGLVGMILALTAAAELFRDLGLATVTIKEKNITHDQISALFWINVGVGIGLLLIFAGSAPAISWFYGDTRLLWVAGAVSSTFLFGGLTIQHQALLRRNMKFTQLAAIQLISTGLSTLVSIILAWKGFGYWALVWREIVRSVATAVGVWLLCRWVPGIPKFGADVRKMFRSGSHVTGFNVLVFGSRSLDQILLGKFWGAESVGLYKQAGTVLQLQYSLVTFPITYVMTPALSALQGEPEKYCKYYKQAVAFLAFFQMPLIAYFAVYSDSIIMVFLGQKWMQASLILQILAIGTLFEAVVSTTGIVMVTSHKTREYLLLGAINAASAITAIAIGVNWGAIGVAYSYMAFSYISLPLVVWFSLRGTSISAGQFYEAISLPLLATLIMSGCLFGIKFLVGAEHGFGEIAYSLILTPLLYCSAWLLFPGGKQKLLGYLLHLRGAVGDLVSRVCSPNPAAT